MPPEKGPKKSSGIGEKILAVNTRLQWRKWLSRYFNRASEIWLVFPKKSSDRHGISYNGAVEEALCFGWIDSTVKSLDAGNKIQRFTPRKPQSPYSQANKERLRWLLGHNIVHPSVLDPVKSTVAEKFRFPADIIDLIRKNKTAWKHYNSFSPSYRRIRIAYIDGARKRPGEFRKRLRNFISKTEKNILIGYGGIDKYY
jgi:uncharacterized protein YdeI (YjbR/CyaY-like superfamily)